MPEKKGYILNTQCTFNGRRYYRGDLGKVFWFIAGLEVPKHFTPLEDKTGRSYEEMDLGQLESLANARGLKVTRNQVGQASKKDLVEALKTDDTWRRQRESMGQSHPIQPTAPPYDQWKKEALAAEMAKRGLVPSGTDNRMTVEEMIAALKADDIAKTDGTDQGADKLPLS